MKKGLISLFGITLTTVVLTSCSLYAKAKENRLEYITMEVNEKCDFAIGDLFFDDADLVVRGHYTNGDTHVYEEEEYTYFLTRYSQVKDITQEFDQIGNYSLRVKADGLYSNVYSFYVDNMHQYTKTLSASGPETVGAGSSIIIQLKTDPIKYNGTITPSVSGSSVTVEKLETKKFKITGINAGEYTIRFSAKTSSTRTVSCSHSLKVKQTVKLQMTIHELTAKRESESRTPTEGDVKFLVVPVWFTDSENYIGGTDTHGNTISVAKAKANIREDIEKAYFGKSDDINWNSVSTYYNKESSGKLNISGIVTDWYITNKASSQYATNSGLIDQIVQAVPDWYFDNHTDVSRTSFDYDHDGYLDAICLVYLAPDYTVTGDSKNELWGHMGALDAIGYKNVNKPGPNPYTWVSYDFLYSRNAALNRTGQEYHNNYGLSEFTITTKVLIHETGHLFGLDDLYDQWNKSRPAGYFSMQDHNLGSHDPYSFLELDWARPIIPTNSGEIVLNDFQSTHEVILLTPQWNTYNSVFDEYLLIELFTPTKLNNFDCYERHDGPSMEGIRLWHVNSLLEDTESRVITPNIYHAYYMCWCTNNDSIDDGNGNATIDPNRLHLIHNDVACPYNTKRVLDDDSLFYYGDSFSMEKYKTQFVNGTKFDFLDRELGWEFEVGRIFYNGNDQYSVTINLTKTL